MGFVFYMAFGQGIIVSTEMGTEWERGKRGILYSPRWRGWWLVLLEFPMRMRMLANENWDGGPTRLIVCIRAGGVGKNEWERKNEGWYMRDIWCMDEGGGDEMKMCYDNWIWVWISIRP
jgi:hypothetical protein